MTSTEVESGCGGNDAIAEYLSLPWICSRNPALRRI